MIIGDLIVAVTRDHLFDPLLGIVLLSLSANSGKRKSSR